MKLAMLPISNLVESEGPGPRNIFKSQIINSYWLLFLVELVIDDVFIHAVLATVTIGAGILPHPALTQGTHNYQL